MTGPCYQDVRSWDKGARSLTHATNADIQGFLRRALATADTRHPARAQGGVENSSVGAQHEMTIEIGQIEAIYRYPVKSMRGEQLDAATLAWHGIDGDRRLAFRRVDERGGNPWLSAGRLPDLISFTPLRQQDNRDALPTHVRTPEGEEMPLFGDALAAEVGRRHGAPVQMMQLSARYLRRSEHLRDRLRHRPRDRPTRGEERRRPAVSSESRCPIHARGPLRGG